MTYIETKNLDVLSRSLFEFYFLQMRARNGQASANAHRPPLSKQLVRHFTNMLLLQRLVDNEEGTTSDPRQLLNNLEKLKPIDVLVRNAVSAEYAETFGIFMVPLTDEDLNRFTTMVEIAFDQAMKLCPANPV